MSEGMADRFGERQDEAQRERDERLGVTREPTPATPAPADPVAAQTRLLTQIAGDMATVRKIAVFFTFLWGIGVVLFLLSLLGRG